MSTPMLFLHLLGAAIWVGGVLFLGLVAGVARRAVGERERIELFRHVGRGFLVLGGIAAILLAISGNALVEDVFGGWDRLDDAGEGDLVLWKTAIFAATLILAIVHGLVLGPRIRDLQLRALGDEGPPADAGRLHSARVLSRVTQVLMLAGSLAVLVLAADLAS